MATTTRTTALQEIREKVVAGERLDLDDGITLLESHDILQLGELADLARRNRGGTDEVFLRPRPLSGCPSHTCRGTTSPGTWRGRTPPATTSAPPRPPPDS